MKCPAGRAGGECTMNFSRHSLTRPGIKFCVLAKCAAGRAAGRAVWPMSWARSGLPERGTRESEDDRASRSNLASRSRELPQAGACGEPMNTHRPGRTFCVLAKCAVGRAVGCADRPKFRARSGVAERGTRRRGRSRRSGPSVRTSTFSKHESQMACQPGQSQCFGAI